MMNRIEQMGFRALADPTRRGILRMLAQDEKTIAEEAENFQMTRAAVKKHLTVLAQGDLILVRKEGRSRVNALNPTGLRQVMDWFGYFDAFWVDRISALKAHIEKDTQ